MNHELKILPMYFNEVLYGVKNFELRKNDRDYKVGDILILKEFNKKENMFTGREIRKSVNYILYGPCYGLKEGYCILGLDDSEKK